MQKCRAQPTDAQLEMTDNSMFRVYEALRIKDEERWQAVSFTADGSTSRSLSNQQVSAEKVFVAHLKVESEVISWLMAGAALRLT